MTTEYREEEYTAKRKIEVRTYCDRCGKDVIEKRHCNTREFALYFAEGNEYGGEYPSRDVEGFQVKDLCDDCITFLRQVLIGNGFNLSKPD